MLKIQRNFWNCLNKISYNAHYDLLCLRGPCTSVIYSFTRQLTVGCSSMFFMDRQSPDVTTKLIQTSVSNEQVKQRNMSILTQGEPVCTPDMARVASLYYLQIQNKEKETFMTEFGRAIDHGSFNSGRSSYSSLNHCLEF